MKRGGVILVIENEKENEQLKKAHKSNDFLSQILIVLSHDAV